MCTTRPLHNEVNSSVHSNPVHLDLLELCAERSDQELAFLRTRLNQSDKNNSDSDECAYCMIQGEDLFTTLLHMGQV